MQVTRPNVTAAILAFVVFAVVLVATGCERPGVDHWEFSGPPLAGWESVVASVREGAPCDPTPWGGAIFHTDHYPVLPDYVCGPYAMGCFVGDYSGHNDAVYLAWAPDIRSSALAHELCHSIQYACGEVLSENAAGVCASAALARIP